MIPIWGFVAVTLPLVLTPGASTAVVLRNSIAGGTRAGVMTAVGINSGSVCYGLITAFGFALAIERWPWAWTLLRAGGLVYLAWLGVESLRRAWLGRRVTESAPMRLPGSPVRQWQEGFVTNILNPAIATFYLVILPQFIPRGAPITRSVLILTAVHVTLAATWHVAWAVAGGTLAHVLGAGRPRQWMEAMSGMALLALALTIALG